MRKKIKKQKKQAVTAARRPGRPKRRGRPKATARTTRSRPAVRRGVSTRKYRPGIYDQFLGLPATVKNAIIAVLILTFSIISLLGMLGKAGQFGVVLNENYVLLFGSIKLLVPIVLIVLSYYLMRTKKFETGGLIYVAAVFFVLSFAGLIHILGFSDDLWGAAKDGYGGGIAGMALSWPLFRFVGMGAGVVVIAGVFLMSSFLFFRMSFERIGGFFAGVFRLLFKKKEKKVEGEIDMGIEQEESPDFESRELEVDMEFEESSSEDEVKEEVREEDEPVEEEEEDEFSPGIKKSSVKIDLPLSLLNGVAGKPTSGDVNASQAVIQKTFKNFGIDVEMGDHTVGPTVTQYTIKPAAGVKLSRVTGLSDNLALALAAHPIRIEAPIPNRSLVGIEVPNRKKAIVPLREVLEESGFREKGSNLVIGLGKDVKGKPHLMDLTKMPHLLVCGQTNSGKSVCIHSIILSFLFQNDPDDLKLIMVDPKRVELPIYDGIPHLLTPVITDNKKTINSLKWAISEMERRFEVLKGARKNNLASFNASVSEEDRMPYIVIIIDELADLMVSSGPEVEQCVVRLTQMARAVGIHLIVATQRPSVDVLTGLIKANIPGRIAFSVMSLIDSRTILDTSGAEKLLGQGDMLYVTGEFSKPRRLQGAFATEEERDRVIKHLKRQAEPEYNEEVIERSSKGGGSIDLGISEEDGDPLLADAKEIILQAGKASASLLQRRLRIGYARAARILDLLEDQKFIGPADGARPREILSQEVSADETDEAPSEELIEEVDEVDEDHEEELDYEGHEEEQSDEEYEEEERR